MVNERELVSRCLVNELAAQQVFYDQYAPAMYGVCLRYAKQDADADDMLQTGFYRTFLKLHQYRFDGPLEHWIRKIIVTSAINFLEMYEKFSREESVSGLDEEVSPDPDAFAALSFKDMLTLIQNLPSGYRAVFNMHVIEGYNHTEIAEMLGITEGTSRSLLSRAKSSIRGRLASFDSV